MANNRPIGVFDSGLGGLTVLKELRAALPCEDFIYFGDTGRVPYGSRGAETVTRYAREDAAFLQKMDVKFIVAACGTVSSICGDKLKAELPVPFTGVVEHGAKAAARETKNHRVGILGTGATVRSGAYEALLRHEISDVQVLAKACPMFVPLVENGYIDPENPVTALIAEEYLAPMRDFGADTLILGCTHYPFLRPIIQKTVGDAVNLVDVGVETAAYVKEQLAAMALCHEAGHKGECTLYASDDVDHMSAFASALLGEGLPPVLRANL